uniref:2-C-methyl-D-erythritol 4-phosphate cytidylyltransferase n=1 Tax=Knipowitschia caucasica TaxID=637954 RepID=A0AAV2KHS6_KNICA
MNGPERMELPADKDELHSGAMSVDFPVCVVLPAGGTGERTGLQTPKQYCPILGRPLISYTVQAFERVSWVQCIVVVVAAESLSLMTDIVQNYRHSKVHVVPGGSTRHRSIRTGVLALGELGGQDGGHGPKVVLIHDAVRPFVDEDFLYKIVTAAKEHGGPVEVGVPPPTQGAEDPESVRAAPVPRTTDGSGEEFVRDETLVDRVKLQHGGQTQRTTAAGCSCYHLGEA